MNETIVDGNAVEHLPVAIRRVVIEAGCELLSDWPHRFVAEMHAADISRLHFHSTQHLHPAWLQAVLDGSLARQNRFVTPDQVREVVVHLRESNRRVTKAEVRRQLRWQGDIADEWLE